MKKLFTALLAMAMLLSLAACGSKGQDTPGSASSGAGNSSSVSSSAGEKESGGDGSTSSASGADSSAQEQPDTSVKEEPKEEPKEETPVVTKPVEKPAAKPETPVSKPAAKPAEDAKQPAQQPSSSEKTEPEQPSQPEQPAVSSGDPLSILNTVWGTYSEDEKFPCAGGDYDHIVDSAPGSFDVSSSDNLTYQLTFPSGDVGLIDSAASLTHMMNSNTFTCGAFHAASKDNVSQLAQDLRSEFQAKHWMCGFPDKIVVATMGQYVVSVYGNEDLVNTFRDKLLSSYSSMTVVYDEAWAG